jgi:cytochrome b involved in lipid metabolism
MPKVWTAINGYVFDVSAFVSEHPYVGPLLAAGCGP